MIDVENALSLLGDQAENYFNAIKKVGEKLQVETVYKDQGIFFAKVEERILEKLKSSVST
jgi:hypothetical protein